MEFRWAADGKTEELRQWLREHPERVNIPAKDSNMTLLYTCISNSNRTDLASLQAGFSSYFSMVRMLCEEYKADVLAPNGGTCNTALHLAASTGATRILRYLVEVLRTPVDCINAFGERPVQMAQRHGQAECTGILAAAAATVASTQSTPPAGARSTPLPVAAGAEQHNAVAGIPGGGSRRFQKVTVSDSDDDGGPSRDNDAPAPAAAAAAALRSSGSGCRRPTDDTGSLSLVTQAIQHGDSSNNGSAPFALLHGRSVSAVASEAHSPLHRRGPNEASSDKAPDIMGAPSMCPPFVSAAFSTPSPPVRPRSEYDISHIRIFANPDLQGFRTAYGDGFKYIRCSDHYEIRGILPYTYRGTVYYTPVLISVYAPTVTAGSSENPTNGGPAEGSSAGGGSVKDKWSPFMGSAGTHTLQATPLASHTMAKTHVYCRYRVCLNMRNLNGFAISRRAEYIDPISGAIIPAPGDDKYQTLTAYIRNVVVRNFEAVPPLIVPTSSYAFPERPNLSQLGSDDGTDVYHHHHSHNSPAFMKNALPKRSAAHIRCATILRELSRFGDGLAQYCPSKHRIVAFVPLFSERKTAVLAVPQKRPCVPAHGQGLQPVVAHAAAAAAATAVQEEGGSSVTGGKAGVTQQVAVEAVAELQVRVLLQFSPTRIGGAAGGSDVSKDGGACVYAQPPRIYLVDAATSPLTRLLDGETSASAGATVAPPSSPSPSSLTAQCFACIIKDRETGEVFQEFLGLSHESWRVSGSVYDILVELQRALRGVLESFAMSYTGRKAASPAARQELQSSGSTHHVDGAPRSAPVVPSPLESFFMPPMAQIQPTMNDASRRLISAAPRSSVGHCLYCAQPLPPSRALLKPCGHDGLCGVCVQRLQSHCREEVFSCPVCRGAVSNVLEIFL
ncbi:hypothetical protein, conserved [Leishmania tarentolae]|uniref:RING-type domain-containing protein n=1 Tax=Leishmania tarentolae TaxID=5689 RepID=A0A640KD59_LEITA|nr:hypothetical protein, conserved [Leishmania tarentolae]